jgi:hypothetical protein
MWKKIWKEFREEFARRASLYLIALVSAGVVGGVYFGDPFYHAGWILSYSQWLFFIFLICAISAIVCYSAIGLILVTIFAIGAAVAFGILYKKPDYLDPLYTWLLHLILVALAVGIVGGGVDWVIRYRKRRSR